MKNNYKKWLVCLGCTLLLFTGTGLNVNTFAVIQPYILKQNGFTNTQTSMISTLRAATNLLSTLLIPFFYRKLGYRRGMTVAAFCSVAAQIIFAFASGIVVFYLAAIISGFGFGLACIVPVTVVINQWFDEDRGTALGICAASTGCATVIFSPILTNIIETYSVRACFLFQGALCMLCTILIFLLVREAPPAVTPVTSAGTASANRNSQTRDPLSPALVILLYCSILLLGAPVTPGFMHLGVLYDSLGVDPFTASYALSLFGLTLAIGKWLFGVLRDKFGIHFVTKSFGAALVLGIGLNMTAGSGNTALLYGSSLLFGLGAASGMVGLPLWAGDLSSPEAFPGRLRFMQFSYSLSSLIFTLVPGVLADWFGSYIPSFIIFTIMAALSIFLVEWIYGKAGKPAK